MTKKNAKKTSVSVNVNVENINVDELLNAVQTAQKQNSIWAEFGPEPAVVAILGVALQQKVYKEETDIVVHMKIVFDNEQEKIRITTIRAFYRKDPETGKNVPRGVAFRNAIALISKAGTKIQRIYNTNENPNLSTFKWTELDEPLVVSIETRESKGRFWPNNVTKYNPINVNVKDIVSECGGVAEYGGVAECEGDAA